jgi:hypothetical protein
MQFDLYKSPLAALRRESADQSRPFWTRDCDWPDMVSAAFAINAGRPWWLASTPDQCHHNATQLRNQLSPKVAVSVVEA